MYEKAALIVCLLLAVESSDARNIHRWPKKLVARDEEFKCEIGYEKCPTVDKCISSRYFCDGDNDCGDDSDEPSTCPPIVCSEGLIKCQTRNRCISVNQVCDGVSDCIDNTDEPEECATRSCPDGKLKCNNGQCIGKDDYCSGFISCKDGTPFRDIDCPSITCDDGYEKCPYISKCIRPSFICDGDNDCGDKSDEPDNCAERLCHQQEFKCNNGQCLNRTAICVGFSAYGCRDSTDMSSVCTNFECPDGYFTCVSTGKCVENSKLCNGETDCLDNSDEAMVHCTKPVECQPGYARCPSSGKCINSRYFCDRDNDCFDNSDEDELFCSSRTCPPDEVRCNNGQCIPISGLCTGYFDCRDGSVNSSSDVCAVPISCPAGEERCPNSRRCINTRYFCDTDNDCGDNSDEDASFCGSRTCEPDAVRCNSGQCVEKSLLCSGSYNCRDGSFGVFSDICGSGSNQPNVDQSPGFGAGLSAECISGMLRFRLQCGEPPSPPVLLGAESPNEIYDKLVEIDLRELCSPYQQWFQCFSDAMDACKAANDLASRPFIQTMDIAKVVLNYGCVQEVDVLNRHKACLLKLEDDIPDSPRSELKPVIATALNRSCHEQIQQLVEIPGELCPRGSDDLQACSKQVVAEQCGDEIASVLDGLADRVRTAADCPSSRLRSIAQLKRRGLSSFTHRFKFLKSFF